jgi:undecaprenyl-diphosphatase
MIWAPIAAAIALLVNQPIVHAVAEKRPFAVMPHTLTLIHHAADPGFPSDHATASGALAIGIVLAHRKWGIAALILAALVAFSRVYVGVHYPVDVLAGLVLGGLVAGFGYFLAVPLLERLVAVIERSRIRILVVDEDVVPGRHTKAVPERGGE